MHSQSTVGNVTLLKAAMNTFKIFAVWYFADMECSVGFMIMIIDHHNPYTANVLTALSTAFGSVACATVIWLFILKPKLAIDLISYSSMSVNVMCTAVFCDNHCQITVAHVTQPMTVNWL